MKSFAIHALLMGCILLMLACNNEPNATSASATNNSTVDSLFQKARVFHDEVMPMMADVMRMSTKLDSLDGKADAQKVQAVKSSLQAADDAMTDWMAVLFKTDFKAMSADSAVQILTKEMNRGTAVKDSIVSSLDRAKQLIESSKQ